ncbi:MAG TPA: hypothetical protein VG407_06730 [Caulobacteraceae bacterium]|jgi:hypothetical protein|nr:hypothetical protein [Caulobacteraceae bacterium]
MQRTTAWVLTILTIVALAGCDSRTAFLKGVFRRDMDDWARRDLYGGAFGELRKDFPVEYEVMKTRLADRFAANGDEASVTRDALGELTAFIAGHGGDVAQAPQDALLRINQQRTRIIEASRADGVDVCAQVARGSTTAKGRLTQPTRDALDRIVTLDIAAAKAGIDHPTRYPPFALSAAEQSAMIADMAAKGLKTPPGGLDTADAATQCGIAAANQRFIAALSPERIAAYESARALQTRRLLGGQ